MSDSIQARVYEHLKASPDKPIHSRVIATDLNLARDRVDTALSNLCHGTSSGIVRVAPATYAYHATSQGEASAEEIRPGAEAHEEGLPPADEDEKPHSTFYEYVGSAQIGTVVRDEERRLYTLTPF